MIAVKVHVVRLPVLLAAGLLLTLAACRSTHTRKAVALNRAMETVHSHYLHFFYKVEHLFYGVEFADREGVSGAASDLLGALDEPAITGYSSDAEYVSSLDGTRAAVRRFLERGSFDEESGLLKLRKQVFRSCQSCHDSYRR